MENTLWQRLSAQDEGCTLHRCETQMSGSCPFYKARKKAENAHIVVANHALLISDAKSENKVIPEYHYLIVDEAHNLEDAITHSQSFRIDHATLVRRLIDLGTPNRGLFGDILRNMRDRVPENDHQKVEQFLQTVSDAIKVMQTHVLTFFETVNTFLKDSQNKGANTDYMSLLRITKSHRGRTSFAHIQTRWNTLDEFFEVVAKSMKRLNKAFRKLEQYNIPKQDNILSATNAIAQYLSEIREQLHQFVLEPDSNMIYWLTSYQTDTTPTIHTAPLHVGPLMEQYLWHEKQAVVLTSATLRTQDSFSYIKERLYADAVRTLEVTSPFDYEQSTLLYVPSDMPEPNNRQAYQRAVERGIIELAAKLEGRVLVLFTSYTQLRQTAQAITPRLALGDITVYDQSDGSSREALLEGFKSNEKAVLLGNKSFWEGVDIPGDSLSALIIVRLPFAVPSDPIFATRSETYSNSFNDFAIPEAILRFRQGFGRLIRTKTDRGVVAIFDSRVQTKGYGSLFLEALPHCTTKSGLLDDLPQTAKDWLDLSSK